mmetsp:Transcript_90823/g.293198  ORF Transcript_90823/g.293198 Transcript_90823/m.293198 type:complete len:421 (-) Transcript_90823:3909-5171(-)
MRPLVFRAKRTLRGTGKARSSKMARPTSSLELKRTCRPTICLTRSWIAAILYKMWLFVCIGSYVAHPIPKCSIDASTTEMGISTFQKLSNKPCPCNLLKRAAMAGSARKASGQQLANLEREIASKELAARPPTRPGPAPIDNETGILALTSSNAAISVMLVCCLSSGSSSQRAILGSARAQHTSTPRRRSVPANSLASGVMQRRRGSRNHAQTSPEPRGQAAEGKARQHASVGLKEMQTNSKPGLAPATMHAPRKPHVAIRAPKWPHTSASDVSSTSNLGSSMPSTPCGAANVEAMKARMLPSASSAAGGVAADCPECGLATCTELHPRAGETLTASTSSGVSECLPMRRRPSRSCSGEGCDAPAACAPPAVDGGEASPPSVCGTRPPSDRRHGVAQLDSKRCVVEGRAATRPELHRTSG